MVFFGNVLKACCWHTGIFSRNCRGADHKHWKPGAATHSEQRNWLWGTSSCSRDRWPGVLFLHRAPGPGTDFHSEEVQKLLAKECEVRELRYVFNYLCYSLRAQKSVILKFILVILYMLFSSDCKHVWGKPYLILLEPHVKLLTFTRRQNSAFGHRWCGILMGWFHVGIHWNSGVAEWPRNTPARLNTLSEANLNLTLA